MNHFRMEVLPPHSVSQDQKAPVKPFSTKGPAMAGASVCKHLSPVIGSIYDSEPDPDLFELRIEDVGPMS